MANMRISGLASGMDIDSIVSDMMKIKKMPLDKLKQEKQVMEWQRDDYREMNTLLLNFRSELTQMKLTTKYRTRTTTTTDDSKVTATASSAAALSSYSISEVSQLASAETKISQAIQQDNADIFDPAKGIYSQRTNFALQEDSQWGTGAILNKTYSAIKGEKDIELTDIPKGIEHSKMSVKVNGIGYKIVTQADIDGGHSLAANEVLINNGTLSFKDKLSMDSTIKVDYIADYRTDSIGISTSSTSLRLGQGSIEEINSISLIEKVDGIEQDPKTFSIGNKDANDLYEILNDTNDVVGKLNKVTGEITEISNELKPEKDSKTTMSLKVTYSHKYTTLSMDTETSNGGRYDNLFISGSESLNSVISKVNSASIGVNMFYDTVTGKMSLTRNETGDFKSGDEITVADNGLGKLFGLNTASVTVDGKDAAFTINGLTTTRSSNMFDINGVSFTLKNTFDKDEVTPVAIAINNDSTAVYENIKKFIDSYNELISKIQGEVQEERFRGYAPLSDEQRESLSDKQQEQWEEKAKSGLLRRDSTLSSLLSSMRMDFYGTVESDNINPIYNQLAKIGIKTTANYLEGGKLEINEAQLKKAIEADPESVESLFNASGTTNGQKGIAQRLYDTVGKTMDILTEKAGKSYSTKSQFTIGRQLESLEDQIDRFEDRMIQLEDRYYRQFTAMEKMIQQANQQSAYIMNNFFA